jgi:hypothetical protein
MPITHFMSEICNLAYLIVENIVEEQYDRPRGRTADNPRRRSMQRPNRSRDTYKNGTRPPKPPMTSQ